MTEADDLAEGLYVIESKDEIRRLMGVYAHARDALRAVADRHPEPRAPAPLGGYEARGLSAPVAEANTP